jgi:hypothetical protein
MDIREQRGLMIAATAKVQRYGERWKVPPQSNNGFYMVSRIAQGQPECSCPDYETRRENCKHIFAAMYVMRRDEHADGTTTVTETVQSPLRAPRIRKHGQPTTPLRPTKKTSSNHCCSTCAADFASRRLRKTVGHICRCQTRYSASRSKSIPLLAHVGL